MQDRGERRPRAGGRSAVLGGRKAASEWLERGRGWADALAQGVGGLLRAEADAARLAPWLAVGFGTGILLYFGAATEPSLAAALVVLLVFALLAWWCREQPLAFGLALTFLAIAAGFTAGCVRSDLIAHPVLTRATGMVTLQGFVEARDGSERSDRIVLRLTGKSGPGAERVPGRVRVAVRRGTAPKVGEHVEVRARLRPLLGPARPGGFDFARNSYFQGLGATGFALGRVTAIPAKQEIPLHIRVRAVLDDVRSSMTDRIRSALPGETGAIASALVTGKRDAIPAAVNEAMRVSGLAHVLAISGMHMVLVVGAIFALVRGGLALIPGLALRYPVKKWTAVVALAGALGYLALSGAAVSTQRAFVMIAVVLLGVLVDRPALTVRTLSAAAVVLLALAPEAILNPSFQMSFAATLALVALFERFAPMIARPTAAGSGMLGRFTERFGRWLLLGAATSLAAGLATAIYAAFHFHRVAPFGLVSNILAMPVLSFVIMPAGLASVLLAPFGYDFIGWRVMGFGIDLMLAVARWVSGLPGSEGRIAAFGAGPVLVATFGLLLLAVPASKLRLAGVPLLAAALVWASLLTPRPDVLADPENGLVAVRTADGTLSILDARRSRLTAEMWLASDGDGRKANDPGLAHAFRCDALGCTAQLPGGALIAVARTREALLEDCGRAALVISRFDVPASCRAPVIDRATLATASAISLRWSKGEWHADAARPPHAERPWFGRRSAAEPAVLSRLRPAEAYAPARASDAAADESADELEDEAALDADQ